MSIVCMHEFSAGRSDGLSEQRPALRSTGGLNGKPPQKCPPFVLVSGSQKGDPRFRLLLLASHATLQAQQAKRPGLPVRG